MKNTYEFNFDDTELTSKLEELTNAINSLDPENMTSGELIEFVKFDRLMQKVREEVLSYAAAECAMHNSMEDN
jgi:hypothetical protein